MSLLEAEDLTSDLQSFLVRTLSEAERVAHTVVVSVPVPFAPLSVFLRAVPRDFSVLWDPGGREPFAYASAGVARCVNLKGKDRFVQMQEQLAELWIDVALRPHPGCKPPPPRVFGGVAFQAGVCRTAPWDEFSDGCFVLPRWTYARKDEDEAVLSLAVDSTQDRGLVRHQELLAEFDVILEALLAYEGEQTRQGRTPLIPRIPRTCLQQVALATWRDHIERIRQAIRGGRFGKIVAARRADLDIPKELQGAIDEVDVLTRLSAEPGCTRFAFRAERSSFIGASPEVLFAKQGANLMTQALAGTLRSLGSDLPVLSQRSSQLLGSEKDLAEHAFVVRQIRDSLVPLCSTVDIPDRPGVSKVRSILHLNTPIRAQLAPGVSAPQLLAALHPTPAVGGVPKREAAEWIAEYEPQQRGWYTGAVGWADMVGDASFVVAIRCGVLTEKKAYIFTGAGIVESSDPEAEYAETELKQLPLLRALGLEEPNPTQRPPPA